MSDTLCAGALLQHPLGAVALVVDVQQRSRRIDALTYYCFDRDSVIRSHWFASTKAWILDGWKVVG